MSNCAVKIMNYVATAAKKSYFKLLLSGENLVVEKCALGSGDKTTAHFATTSPKRMSVVKYGVTKLRRLVT